MEEEYFETFRFNVKFYREKKKISQSQLAIGADCTNGLIGQIEAGSTKPSFDRIVNIAAALNIHPAALNIHPADLFLRNATVTNTKNIFILRKGLIPQIEKFVERKL